MSNASDFVIENGVLKKYVGPGGDVVIPDGVTSIGNLAFWSCKTMTNVTIPEGEITSIKDWAFSDCKNLRDIFLPVSVTAIGKGIFDNCTELTIHAPAGSYAEQYAKENNIPFVAEQ